VVMASSSHAETPSLSAAAVSAAMEAAGLTAGTFAPPPLGAKHRDLGGSFGSALASVAQSPLQPASPAPSAADLEMPRGVAPLHIFGLAGLGVTVPPRTQRASSACSVCSVEALPSSANGIDPASAATAAAERTVADAADRLRLAPPSPRSERSDAPSRCDTPGESATAPGIDSTVLSACASTALSPSHAVSVVVSLPASPPSSPPPRRAEPASPTAHPNRTPGDSGASAGPPVAELVPGCSGGLGADAASCSGLDSGSRPDSGSASGLISGPGSGQGSTAELGSGTSSGSGQVSGFGSGLGGASVLGPAAASPHPSGSGIAAAPVILEQTPASPPPSAKRGGFASDQGSAKRPAYSPSRPSPKRLSEPWSADDIAELISPDRMADFMAAAADVGEDAAAAAAAAAAAVVPGAAGYEAAAAAAAIATDASEGEGAGGGGEGGGGGGGGGSGQTLTHSQTLTVQVPLPQLQLLATRLASQLPPARTAESHSSPEGARRPSTVSLARSLEWLRAQQGRLRETERAAMLRREDRESEPRSPTADGPDSNGLGSTATLASVSAVLLQVDVLELRYAQALRVVSHEPLASPPAGSEGRLPHGVATHL